jgi:hypothetical protein
MAPKEENELSIIKKACQVSVDLFNKYLKEQVMEIVDADKKVMKLHYRLVKEQKYSIFTLN